jgi:hypothetical protein
MLLVCLRDGALSRNNVSKTMGLERVAIGFTKVNIGDVKQQHRLGFSTQWLPDLLLTALRACASNCDRINPVYRADWTGDPACNA